MGYRVTECVLKRSSFDPYPRVIVAIKNLLIIKFEGGGKPKLKPAQAVPLPAEASAQAGTPYPIKCL
jgi:hypothetical protein